MKTWPKLNPQERNVFQLHLIFSLVQGVLTGVFALNEYVFIKDIFGTEYQLSFLFQSAALVFLFSIFVNEFLKRIVNKKRMLRVAAILTHLPLLALIFFPRQPQAYVNSFVYSYIFLAVFFVFYINTVVILPTINQMLKNNYSHENFGKLYSYSSALNKLVIMIATLLFGFLLDIDNYSFVYIYPLLSIFGVSSIFLLSKISYPNPAPVKLSFLTASINGMKQTFETLKTNKPYLHFELGFMFYGFAWMVATAVIPIYFNEVFQMNHATYGFYKNGYNLLAIILLPYFGGLIGRVDPRKFGVYTFGSLMLFSFVLIFAGNFQAGFNLGEIRVYWVLMIAYGFYGVFAATMALLWFIGSAYFCKSEEAARYQSIHLTLTGIRSLFSFQIGVALYQWLGYEFTFSVATFSLLIAVLLMFFSYKFRRNSSLA